MPIILSSQPKRGMRAIETIIDIKTTENGRSTPFSSLNETQKKSSIIKSPIGSSIIMSLLILSFASLLRYGCPFK
ncbi:MAG: hypothetical protein ACD_77C00355G0001 [uncultured bacterium]|nr:MAG: hypothetical protein ACD_77C00355G0001 [uncultured bacterium]